MKWVPTFGQRPTNLRQLGMQCVDSLQIILRELRPCPGGASTRAGRKEAQKKRENIHLGLLLRGKLHTECSAKTDFMNQLNFESARNKNSMPIFMRRLPRVYHT